MKTLKIALKEIKVGLRDRRTFLFMLAFPIVLMLILGTALTNAFSSGLSVDAMNLLYRTTTTNQQLEDSWKQFAAAIEKEGVEVASAADSIDGKVEVSEDRYTAYAEIGDNGISFYGSPRHTLESNVLQGMLSTFADRYNLAAASMGESPEKAKAILAGADAASGKSFIAETSIQAGKKPGSFDYYAIAMTTMIAFYACMSASSLIRGERLRHTAIRLSAAPISKASIFTGKVLGSTVINFLCVVVVVFFSKLAFKADWGALRHRLPYSVHGSAARR